MVRRGVLKQTAQVIAQRIKDGLGEKRTISLDALNDAASVAIHTDEYTSADFYRLTKLIAGLLGESGIQITG